MERLKNIGVIVRMCAEVGKKRNELMLLLKFIK